MPAADLTELEQLALVAELARPVAHECNNLLNNLLLQLAISEKAFPEPFRAEWANIRREGKKLANLLQQWQRYRKPAAEGPVTLELNALMREIVEELRPKAGAIDLIVRQAAEPLYVMGFAGETRRLGFLLLGHALAAAKDSGGANPALAIQLERSQHRIIMRLLDASPADANLHWTDFDDTPSFERGALSLPALTCRSLVERLGGMIRIEKEMNGRLALAIDFPPAVS